MEKLLEYKNIVSSVTGVFGGFILAIFGNWTEAMTALLVLMIIDYLTGLLAAGTGHSKKTESGGLQSKVGLMGLAKKAFVILLVVAMHFVDSALGIDYFRDVAVIGFIANEVLSIVENAGLMGIGLPKGVTKAIDVLRSKEDQEESD